MEIFEYSFMMRGIIVAIMISIVAPLIGNIIMLRRLSSVGDALAHSSLAGVAVGLVFGYNPVFSALVYTIFAGLVIDYLRRKFEGYQELATGVVLALGISLASILSSFNTSANDFDSFLFGSIAVITKDEFYLTIIMCVLVIIVMIYYYKDIMHMCLDEQSAFLAGVKVKKVNLIVTTATAVVVAIASRTIGALIVSSLLVLPIATAMLISRSYLQNIMYGIMFAVIYATGGLYVSYIYELKPGGTIVFFGVIILMLILFIKMLLGKNN